VCVCVCVIEKGDDWFVLGDYAHFFPRVVTLTRHGIGNTNIREREREQVCNAYSFKVRLRPDWRA